MLKRILERLRGLVSPNERYLGKQLCLQCLLLAKLNRPKEKLDSLSESEFSGFSQWGEDGIIDWLIERLPSLPHTFVEFGVGDYREANTRLLLYLRNWRGFVMDGSAEHINNIKNQDIYWRYDLTAKCTFIDCDNVNELIAQASFNGDIGLLSIDVDGNDYWVWQAIKIVRAVQLSWCANTMRCSGMYVVFPFHISRISCVPSRIIRICILARRFRL